MKSFEIFKQNEEDEAQSWENENNRKYYIKNVKLQENQERIGIIKTTRKKFKQKQIGNTPRLVIFAVGNIPSLEMSLP